MDIVKRFAYNNKIFVAGSTWPADEQLLSLLAKANPDWKFIIAAHEIDPDHISSIQTLFPDSLRYSNAVGAVNEQVLVIDNIGLLSSIYQYGDIAYIGGGFGVGIHNTLEAAAFGIPVIFGPNYQKFQEAKDLIRIGAAKSIANQYELIDAFKTLLSNPESGKIASNYVDEQKGSTDKILSHLKVLLDK